MMELSKLREGRLPIAIGVTSDNEVMVLYRDSVITPRFKQIVVFTFNEDYWPFEDATDEDVAMHNEWLFHLLRLEPGGTRIELK